MEKTRKPIDPSRWRWYGSPAHFICASWCRFHLATEIGRFVVSTVGEYVHPRHSKGSEREEAEWLRKNSPGEDVGFQRKYETMLFLKTGYRCTLEDCKCGQPTIQASELICKGANTRGDATKNHYAVCKLAAKGKLP